MHVLRAIEGDITTLEVDAIVNAANNTLLGGGGVDGAIHRKAGPELLKECSTLGGCRTGQAKITGGYNLPAKYIIHTVGPVWRGGDHHEAELLASCYRETMQLAQKNDIETLAFPAISCGVYGYPLEGAAQIATSTLNECVRHNKALKQVWLVCFNDDTFSVCHQHLKKLMALT